MLLNKTDAAKVAGVSRRSFYNHIPKKKISVTQDADGEEKVDVSELKRVYGDERVALNLKKFLDERGGVQEREDVQPTVVQPSANNNKAEIELEVLRERLNHFDEYKQERVREREQLEERIGQLESTLQQALDNQNKTTLLLEHYTKGEEGSDDWKKSIKALEEKIENQEKESKEKAEQDEKHKELLLAKVSEHESEKKDLSKANKIYAGLALLAVFGALIVAATQSGIINL
jgi:AcrR family transcriptional regulator